MQIARLLIYEFPDDLTAIKQLNNRGIKGTQVWANCSISEQFYHNDPEVEKVLEQVVTPVVKGEPPDPKGEPDGSK